MTLAQIILFSVLPLSALSVLIFAYWHDKRHPPERMPRKR